MRFLNAAGNPLETLFAFRIPYLPDFLADHTLLGNSPSERLREVLERFQRFVIGFRKYRGSAFALRFWAQPGHGQVDVFLLCRLRARPGEYAVSPALAASDISAHLTSFGIPHAAVTPASSPPIEQLMHPFGANPCLVEVRQHEQIVQLMTVGKSAYVIHPYWKPGGLLLEPFETMLHQPFPAMLSIYLEPTELSDEEYFALGEASFLAQTVADMEMPAVSPTAVVRRRDPGADLVSRIYSQYIQTLAEPFLMTVQAASTDANTAWTIARSYAAGITGPGQGERDSPGENGLPSGTDVVTPRSPEEQGRARNTFAFLNWQPWGASSASQHKERMPYLVGAGGASAAFRFPISQRGGVPGVQVREMAPEFEPGPRPDRPGAGQIHLGNYRRGGAAVANLRDLTRHALVTGFTGSGKTNTVLYLLDQLWRTYHLPFLVIEAAKKEYRSLARVPGFEDLLIFTLGDETTSPFRLNPFEMLPGVRLEAHLGRLQACFDAALPQFGILPSIIAEAMEDIYKTRGWKLTDRAADPEGRAFPTMRDMFTTVIQVAEQRGYAGETYHNIRAAAAGRLGSLLRGSKGRMFGCLRSFPAEILFRQPVILELNDLNQDDKALTMMYLLTWLREYRELHPSRDLQHITVVEEAHNVLSNQQSVGNTEVAADTKAKAVDAFSGMLAEVRAYGEGLVISDQSPEKLAPDAMRNTNLQIAHQLRDQRDREAVARAMIMDEQQRDYLGKLGVGEAAVFQTGSERATFISVPEYKDTAGFHRPPSDDEVRQRMAAFQRQFISASLPFEGCRFCAAQCAFRDGIEPQTLNREVHESLIQALKRFEEHPEPAAWPGNWRKIAEACRAAADQAGYAKRMDAAFCYLAHEIDFRFTAHMRKSFEIAFTEISGG